MRRGHLERLAPRCPRCRRDDERDARLALERVLREEGDHVLQGVLECAACHMEYPIVDGIPIILYELRRYIADHVLELVARDDLDPILESVIGDCCGPGSSYDALRQHLSSYAWDHYGDLDPVERSRDPAPGALQRILRRGRELAGATPPGAVLDVGCGVGRTTFELAPGAALVLGVDLHFSMLRLAARVLREGVVRYPRRRVGAVYDGREFNATFADAERVDFWACDALALPFAPATFAFGVSLNLLDCVRAPRDHLAELARVLSPGGRALLATPYDWSPTATPFEAWVGGHSQRGPDGGAAEPVLRALIGGDHPSAVAGLRLIAEDDVPWHVRLHERYVARYRTHLLALEATGARP